MKSIQQFSESPTWIYYLGAMILHALICIIVALRIARSYTSHIHESSDASPSYKNIGVFTAQSTATSTQRLSYLGLYLRHCYAEKGRTGLALENLESRYDRLEDEVLTGRMQLFSEQRRCLFPQRHQEFYRRHCELREIEVELESMHITREAMQARIDKLAKEIAVNMRNRDKIIAAEEEKEEKETIDVTLKQISTLRERLDNTGEGEPQRELLQASITSLETDLSEYMTVQALKQERRELKASLREEAVMSTEVEERIAETEFHLGLVHAALGRRNGLVSRPMTDL